MGWRLYRKEYCKNNYNSKYCNNTKYNSNTYKNNKYYKPYSKFNKFAKPANTKPKKEKPTISIYEYNKNIQSQKAMNDKLYYLVNKALKGVEVTKTIPRQLKTVDNYIPPGTNMGTSPSVQVVSNLGFGYTDYERTGSTIIAKDLFLTGAILQDQQGANPLLIRIALVIDTQFQGNTPSWVDIFKPSVGVGTPINFPLNTFDYPGRFKVLYDETFDLGSNINDDPDSRYIYFSEGSKGKRSVGIYRNLHNMVMKYDGDTLSTQRIVCRQNTILLCRWAQVKGFGGVQYPLWDYNVRLRYYDK